MDYMSTRAATMLNMNKLQQSDATYKRDLAKLYAGAQTEIESDINNLLVRYSGIENVSLDEAMKRITKGDVILYQKRVEQLVKRDTFTPQANQVIRHYNVTTRTNRLQYLSEMMRLNTVALAGDEQAMLANKLMQEVFDEYETQVGIFNVSMPTPKTIQRAADIIVNADYKGATFSDRIWADQSALQGELDNVVRRVLLQGQNPRQASRRLENLVNDKFKNKRSAAETLAITESARVQVQAQDKAFNEIGVDRVEWVSEQNERTCSICSGMDGKQFPRATMFEQEHTIPAHPRCRCSYAGVVDREAWEKGLLQRGL